jgi:hypothetical protein
MVSNGHRTASEKVPPTVLAASLHVVKYMGGWAKNNSVTKGKYIDPTMTPFPAAWQFFGWLVLAKPLYQD